MQRSRQTDGRAMPSARATHATHRANLRCLGLSVGIAIALVGCSPYTARRDWREDEVPATTYADIATGLEYENDECRGLARGAMDDGKITYGELEQINACDARSRNAAVDLPSAKAKIAASGTEAGTVETEGLDPKDDGPTSEAGDAQGVSHE